MSGHQTSFQAFCWYIYSKKCYSNIHYFDSSLYILYIATKFASICSKKPDLTLYSEYETRSHLVPSYYNSDFFHDHLNWASRLMKRKLPKNIKSWKIIVIGILSTRNQRITVACPNPPSPGRLSYSHQIDDRRSLDGDISQYCVVV